MVYKCCLLVFRFGSVLLSIFFSSKRFRSSELNYTYINQWVLAARQIDRRTDRQSRQAYCYAKIKYPEILKFISSEFFFNNSYLFLSFVFLCLVPGGGVQGEPHQRWPLGLFSSGGGQALWTWKGQSNTVKLRRYLLIKKKIKFTTI